METRIHWGLNLQGISQEPKVPQFYSPLVSGTWLHSTMHIWVRPKEADKYPGAQKFNSSMPTVHYPISFGGPYCSFRCQVCPRWDIGANIWKHQPVSTISGHPLYSSAITTRPFDSAPIFTTHSIFKWIITIRQRIVLLGGLVFVLFITIIPRSAGWVRATKPYQCTSKASI